MEQKIMMMLGERDFAIAQQATAIEQLQARIKELEDKLPKEEKKNENK